MGHWSLWIRLVTLRFLQKKEKQWRQIPNPRKWKHGYFSNGTVAAYGLILTKFRSLFINFPQYFLRYKKLSSLVIILFISDNMLIFHITPPQISVIYIPMV